MNNSDKPSWLHRSPHWGTKPHVDIGDSHGHSPTIWPPAGIGPDGTIPIRRTRADSIAGKFGGMLPPPYGPVDDRFNPKK